MIEPLPAGSMRVPLNSDGTVPLPREGSYECPENLSTIYSRTMQSEEFGTFEVAVPERRWHEAEEASFPPESWPVPSKETFQTLHTINCNPAFRAITRQHAGMLYNFKPGDKYILKNISANKTESVVLHNNRITGDDAIVHRRRNHRDPIFCGRPWLEQDALDPNRKARPEELDPYVGCDSRGCGDVVEELHHSSYGNSEHKTGLISTLQRLMKFQLERQRITVQTQATKEDIEQALTMLNRAPGATQLESEGQLHSQFNEGTKRRTKSTNQTDETRAFRIDSNLMRTLGIPERLHERFIENHSDLVHYLSLNEVGREITFNDDESLLLELSSTSSARNREFTDETTVAMRASPEGRESVEQDATMESMNRSLDRYNQASPQTAATLGVPRHIQNAGWYLAPTSSEEATNGSRELDDSMQEQNAQPQSQEHQNVSQDSGVAQESQQEQSDTNVQASQHQEPAQNVDLLAEQKGGSPA